MTKQKKLTEDDIVSLVVLAVFILGWGAVICILLKGF